jgi:hypothetical protein
MRGNGRASAVDASSREAEERKEARGKGKGVGQCE